jgi:hypothetical protein
MPAKFRDGGSDFGVLNRAEFWDTVTHRLDRLDNRIPIKERKNIETVIARKVPRPTKKTDCNRAPPIGQACRQCRERNLSNQLTPGARPAR